MIVVTGGVISGVGKGVATASIGRILQEYGFSVTAVKIDPYINYDAGTLRPTEHGEVWVTDDGGEIDQDLGNYERFLDIDIPKCNNITTGQIYKTLIDKERKGEFLGQTVEVIPHVPNEVKRRIIQAADNYDFVLVEIGGTVGDYQNLPFLYATKSMEAELGRNNILNILVSYLPVPSHVGEMKTKPTQQAIRMLNETGIFPDFVLCRSDHQIDEVRKKKLEMVSNLPLESVISAPDIKTIYRIPLNFEKEELGLKILNKFGLRPKKVPNWNNWERLVENIENPKAEINIAMVGKYVDIGDFSLSDSYISINHALRHAGAEIGVGVNIKWIDSKKFESGKADILSNFSGIVIPGGFGASGIEGKIEAIRFARENNIPFLGLCYGLQLAVVEFARNMLGMEANTTEVDPNTKNPVIDIIFSQRRIVEDKLYGGTMRLGAYAAMLDQGAVYDLYKKTGRLEADAKKIKQLEADTNQAFRLGILKGDAVIERHRHRFEVNPSMIEILGSDALKFSGHHVMLDGTKLIEFAEIPHHKFFIGTQAHPEFKSRLGDPAPLFLGFVEACSN